MTGSDSVNVYMRLKGIMRGKYRNPMLCISGCGGTSFGYPGFPRQKKPGRHQKRHRRSVALRWTVVAGRHRRDGQVVSGQVRHQTGRKFLSSVAGLEPYFPLPDLCGRSPKVRAGGTVHLLHLLHLPMGFHMSALHARPTKPPSAFPVSLFGRQAHFLRSWATERGRSAATKRARWPNTQPQRRAAWCC